jgi:hypothetical protein
MERGAMIFHFDGGRVALWTMPSAHIGSHQGQRTSSMTGTNGGTNISPP